MTQLLVSVKNVSEALLALDAGVDIIDLKDPNIGALGALDLKETKLIVQAINRHALVSATVGEQHRLLKVLIDDIQARAELGVNAIKIAVSELFYSVDFLREVAKLSNAGVKVIAVFFAEDPLDFTMFAALQKAGFYGAMLDTRIKHKNLLQLQTKYDLQSFTQSCNKYHLQSGLAGSLQSQHVLFLLEFGSTYIGFRGGVCDNLERKSTLSHHKVLEIKNMLYQHNKTHAKAQENSCLALHS
jgi:(5-formylfuran-3-yl)methyl phosphate synthase